MAMPNFLKYLLMIAMTRSHSFLTCTSKSSTECNIDCDGAIDCSHSVIDCNTDGADLDCYIGCNTLGTNGCFDSTIYCTSQHCSIDCSHGCTNISIHAEDAAHLYIKNCNTKKETSYCSNMEIFCPQNTNTPNINPVCIIEGDDIKSSNIFTVQGFNDVELIDITPTNTKIYCGINTEYWCSIDGTQCAISDDDTCDHYVIDTTAQPTPQPISLIIAVEDTIYIKPTTSMKKEGEVEADIMSTKALQYDDDMDTDQVIEYRVIRRQSGDVDLEIVVLSGICFVLLVCCVFFCTLWITRGEHIVHKEITDIKQRRDRDALKLSNDLTVGEKDKRIYGTADDVDIDIEMVMRYNNKQRVGSIFTDNLSVVSMSNVFHPQWNDQFTRTPSMGHHSDNGMMNLFQNAMVSVCNSAMTSDWEDDGDIGFDDVLSQTGETPHLDIKADEFIVVGEEGDDCDCETPGASDVNNNNEQ